mmetsp:Transcript_17439/g.48614  ORF Transcript_17439/g.48614 Transcript_17439/m.48614 type:complete len:206 (-) Transcript_17439:2936-3553(-)
MPPLCRPPCATARPTVRGAASSPRGRMCSSILSSEHLRTTLPATGEAGWWSATVVRCTCRALASSAAPRDCRQPSCREARGRRTAPSTAASSSSGATAGPSPPLLPGGWPLWASAAPCFCQTTALPCLRGSASSSITVSLGMEVPSGPSTLRWSAAKRSLQGTRPQEAEGLCTRSIPRSCCSVARALRGMPPRLRSCSSRAAGSC